MTPRTSASATLWLTPLGCVLGIAAFRYGGGRIDAWSLTLLAIGLIGILWFVGAGYYSPPDADRPVVLLALLFPAFVAFQLIPLPVFLLDVLSPTRAEIAQGLSSITTASRFAPLTINASETTVHLSRVVGYTLVFLLVWRISARFNRPWMAAVPLIAIGGCEAVWGLSQYLAGARVISGTYLNRNHFANLLAMVLPFALMSVVAIIRNKNPRQLPVSAALLAAGWFVLAVGLLLAIVLSSSRMGFLSTMASVLVMTLLLVHRGFSRWRRWAALVTVALAAVLVFLFLPSDSFVREFSDIPTDTRGPIWKDSLALVRAYPIFGSGLHTYYPGLLRYQTVALEYGWPEAHNDYIQLLAELGIVGLMIPLILVTLVLSGAVRSAVSDSEPDTRHFAVGCVGSVVALLFHSMADFNLYVPANAMTFAWVLGLSSSVCAPPKPPAASQMRSNTTERLAAGTLLALSLFGSVYAAGWLVYLHMYRDNPRVEAVLCRMGICETDRILGALQQLRGTATIAALPPEEQLKFLRRDPANPNRWSTLGEAFQHAGRVDEARRAFDRAIELGPRIPNALSKAAQFHLSVGNTAEGFALTKAAIEGDPSRLHVFVEPYWHQPVDKRDLLANGIPDDPLILRTLLRQRMTEGTVDETAAVWTRLIERRHLDSETAGRYVESLVQRDLAKDAWEAWREYAVGALTSQSAANRVSNGDFEADPAPTRFDWRMPRGVGFSVGFDREVRYSGSRSLRIVFDGAANPTDLGVRQVLFLEEGRYRLAAYVRTDGISTDQGVGFTIASEGSPALRTSTRELRGTNDWTLVEHEFEAPAGGGLARVSLTRQRSFKFDNLVRGTVWVDGVSLMPVPPA